MVRLRVVDQVPRVVVVEVITVFNRISSPGDSDEN
jgi:hypothetical protein|tara:strand:+ start:631 stop:735 length:105 start_codon:yes stop_codon:yes gene_type:complete